MGYTEQVIKGISWVGGIRIVTRILSFGKTLVIARILVPAQFGVFGIATLILSLVEIITETGINVFLVQQKEEIDKYINTAWIVSIFRGILISLTIFLLSGFVSDFFHAPNARTVIALIAIVPFIRGFINPAITKLQKDLMFRKDFYYRSALFGIETVFSIVFILISPSVESLVWGMVVGALAEVICSFLIVKPTPVFVFNGIHFKNILHSGKWVTASGVLNYFYQHGDDIAVGRMLNTSALGLYDMAYRISLAPISDIGDVISKVSFPVFTKISHEKKRLQLAFIKSLLGVTFLVFPIGLIIFFFPETIIQVVLGPQWILAAPVLQVLALFGVIRAISSYCNALFLALGKQNIITLTSFVSLLGLAVTIIPFIYAWGIVGAGLSAVTGSILTIPFTIYFVWRLLR